MEDGREKRQTDQHPFLTVIWGTNFDFGKEMKLGERPVLIGRSKEANFRLTDRMVSRRHCVIRPVREKGNLYYLIEDVGSSNGTYVNEERIINKKILTSGDKIRVGETIIKFHYKDEYDTMFFQKLYKMAVYDGHTGLLNKSFFMDEMKIQFEIASRQGLPLSFVIFDLDDFKQVNDKYGHPVGDIVLKKIAEIITTSKRTQDIAGRLGGEEFGVLLPATDLKGAVALGERIRENVEKTLIRAYHETIRITVSAGISNYPLTASSLSELINQADQALYQAKRMGKNKVLTYLPIAGEGK